jgi:hypothetical protein
MASRSVTSPHGKVIEIVEDDDWALTAGVSLKSLKMWDRSKPFVIRDLWEYGPATNESGGATQVLYDRMLKHYPHSNDALGWPKSLSTMMAAPYNAPAFDRQINGKRCYGIDLVALPEIWYRKLNDDLGVDMPTFTATPVSRNGEHPEPPPPVAPPEITHDDFERLIMPAIPEDSGPSIEVEIAGQVAMEMLTRVVEIIAAGSVAGYSDARLRQLQSEYETVTARLSQRLEESERMRRQLRVTGEELAAVKMERDSLRQRLRQTEANLTSALKGESAHAVTTEVMKRVDRIMRETPQPNRREG